MPHRKLNEFSTYQRKIWVETIHHKPFGELNHLIKKSKLWEYYAKLLAKLKKQNAFVASTIVLSKVIYLTMSFRSDYVDVSSKQH